MFNRVSPFVVDQRGSKWFWLAVLPAIILATIFRLAFSESRVSNELRKAFSKIEPEVKVQFSGAKLSLSDGILYPQISIQIFDIEGVYLLDSKSDERPIRFKIDVVRAPIPLFELFSGRLGLSFLDIGHLQINLEQSFLSKWQEGSLSSIQDTLPVLAEKDSVSASLKQEEVKESRYQPQLPRPVERVKIKSLRPEGAWGSSLGLELRAIDLIIAANGKAELSSQVGFLFEKWGHQPSLPIFMRWDPEDKFISTNIAGRWREGQMNVSFILDPSQDFFNLEGSVRSLPMLSFLPFLRTLLSFDKQWTQNLTWPNILQADSSGWGSFDFGVSGYLIQDKPSLFTLRNLLIEEGSEKLEVSRYSQSLSPARVEIEPFGVTLREVSYDRLKALFGLPDLDYLLLNQGIFSGAVQVLSKQVYESSRMSMGKHLLRFGRLEMSGSNIELGFKSDLNQTNLELLVSEGSLLHLGSEISQVKLAKFNIFHDQMDPSNRYQRLFIESGVDTQGSSFQGLSIDFLKNKISVANWSNVAGVWVGESEMGKPAKVNDVQLVAAESGWESSFKHLSEKKWTLLSFEGQLSQSSPDTLQGRVTRKTPSKVTSEVLLPFWPVLFLVAH